MIRLFFLINDDYFPYASEVKIIPDYRSDHSGIVFELALNTNERGRGYWKFNNSLLKDQQYVRLVKNTISEVKQTYRINNGENNIDNQEQELSINDRLFLETLLLMIRGSTIKYSSQRKKQRQEDEAKLEQDIKLIEEEEVNANFLNLSEDVLDELENKISLLNEIQKEKIEGVLLRSRSRYEDLGEKPSHYFF